MKNLTTAFTTLQSSRLIPIAPKTLTTFQKTFDELHFYESYNELADQFLAEFNDNDSHVDWRWAISNIIRVALGWDKGFWYIVMNSFYLSMTKFFHLSWVPE